MIALINPAALPALRIAATFFFLIYLAGGAYIFRNRHRFFDRDANARCHHAYPDSADQVLARLTSAGVCHQSDSAIAEPPARKAQNSLKFRGSKA